MHPTCIPIQKFACMYDVIKLTDLITEQLTDRGTALFSGELSLALAHTRVDSAGEIRHPQEGGSEDKAALGLKKKVADWFTGERPRTVKVYPRARTHTHRSDNLILSLTPDHYPQYTLILI